jgi:hypothetical protein
MTSVHFFSENLIKPLASVLHMVLGLSKPNRSSVNSIILLKNNLTVVQPLFRPLIGKYGRTYSTDIYIVFNFAYVGFAGLSHVACCTEMRDTKTAVRESVNNKQNYREKCLRSSKGRFTRKLQ